MHQLCMQMFLIKKILSQALNYIVKYNQDRDKGKDLDHY